MGYFPVCFERLKAVARAGDFEDVAGFLVLSRHGDGIPLPGHAPHRFSRAGVNAVHEKVGIAEEAARGVLSRLVAGKFVQRAQVQGLPVSKHPIWDLLPRLTDLYLPHSFVDRGPTWDSPIRRIKKMASSEPAGSLHTRSKADEKLDCLMLLLTLQLRTGMSKFGGLDPAFASRPWRIESRETAEFGTRWGATPQQESFDQGFVEECLAHVADLKGQREQNFPRFKAAWDGVKSLGLIYEAVTLFGGTSHKAPGSMNYTVRINDFFAGSKDGRGDPSVMTGLEAEHGALLGFYTQPNAKANDEALRVVLPDDSGQLVGIWRPRFRPAAQEVGKWHEADKRAVELAVKRVCSAQSMG